MDKVTGRTPRYDVWMPQRDAPSLSITVFGKAYQYQHPE